MAVVIGSGERFADDENAEVIQGRPDFADRTFGKTRVKTFPPYIFSIRGVSCLVHKIRYVECHWYRCGGHGEYLVRMKKPVMIATTMCAQSWRLEPLSSRTCHIPSPDALLCGRCHGEGATFGKRGPDRNRGLTRQEAHVKLGCVVQGY